MVRFNFGVETVSHSYTCHVEVGNLRKYQPACDRSHVDVNIALKYIPVPYVAYDVTALNQC